MTNFTVEDLEPDVEYEFRVSAENSIGTSEPTVSSPLKYGLLRRLFCREMFIRSLIFDSVARILLDIFLCSTIIFSLDDEVSLLEFILNK